MSRWERWNPRAGVVAVVGMVIGFGLVTSSSTNDSDAKITAIVFVPVFVYWAWLLLASALLTLRSLRSPGAAAPATP